MKKYLLVSLCVLSLFQAVAQKVYFSRGDSLLACYDYPGALTEYMSVCEADMTPSMAMNAAIAAAQCDRDSLAAEYVSTALKADSVFFDERISVSELLQDCRLLPVWDALQSENERRIADVTQYDIPLRNRLLEIYHSDQNPRGHLIMTGKAHPEDKETIGRLWKEIQHNDSINLGLVVELLDTHGWISRSLVGTANQALFFVVQHATPDIIDRYIPLFESAALSGEIPKDLFAKMYDRNLMYSGKPQKYGTQRVRESPESKTMVLWKIADPEKVNAFRREMDLPPLAEFPE